LLSGLPDRGVLRILAPFHSASGELPQFALALEEEYPALVEKDKIRVELLHLQKTHFFFSKSSAIPFSSMNSIILLQRSQRNSHPAADSKLVMLSEPHEGQK